jgi:HSP20 family protein
MTKKAKTAKPQKVAVKSAKKAVPASPQRRIDDLLNQYFDRRWPRLFDWPDMDWPKPGALTMKSGDTRMPSMDVIDREKEVLIRAELPGINKEDINVSVSGNSVTVQGSTRKESESDKDQYHHREIVSSFVSRTLPLSCEVDGDKAVARLDNGLLEVTIPKVERATRKRVEIQS